MRCVPGACHGQGTPVGSCQPQLPQLIATARARCVQALPLGDRAGGVAHGAIPAAGAEAVTVDGCWSSARPKSDSTCGLGACCCAVRLGSSQPLAAHYCVLCFWLPPSLCSALLHARIAHVQPPSLFLSLVALQRFQRDTRGAQSVEPNVQEQWLQVRPATDCAVLDSARLLHRQLPRLLRALAGFNPQHHALTASLLGHCLPGGGAHRGTQQSCSIIRPYDAKFLRPLPCSLVLLAGGAHRSARQRRGDPPAHSAGQVAGAGLRQGKGLLWACLRRCCVAYLQLAAALQGARAASRDDGGLGPLAIQPGGRSCEWQLETQLVMPALLCRPPGSRLLTWRGRKRRCSRRVWGRPQAVGGALALLCSDP